MSKTALLLIIAILTGAFYVFLNPSLYSLNKKVSVQEPAVTISPTQVPIQIGQSEVRSPDGTMTLLMKSVRESNGSVIYSFTVSNIPDSKQLFTYTKTLKPKNFMIVPPNAWSPDNKLFFIEEDDLGTRNYFVFKASGNTFSDNQLFIDVEQEAKNRKFGYLVNDVTGWDSSNLLHVVTTKDNTAGPSFWFDIYSTSFIELATH